MNAIKTNGLTKRYGVKLALDTLNLNVKKGDVYGFIGRNGAGKTTTINLILSLIHRTEGTIEINGEAVSFADPSYKSRIGYVPDVPVFPGYMNAEEYIRYACEMNNVPKEDIKQRIIDVLEFVDLSDRKKRISAYSRGMKQRLAIAQAIVHDPEIIIMDEPTSALDPIGRKDVMNIILKLKGNKTVFYSTHILEDVEKVCDTIGIVEQGRLVLQASMDTIKEDYFDNDMLIVTEEPVAKAYELLQASNLKNDIRTSEDGILCEIKNKTTAHDILQLLLKNGFHIIEFKRQKVTLEDVFIEVTNHA